MKQIVVNGFSTTYFITEDGKCFNSSTNKFLKGQYNKENFYLTYNLKLPNGANKRLYAHRLVAQAFVPNPLKKPEIRHKDGNKANNCTTNLEWVADSKHHRPTPGVGKCVGQFSKEGELIRVFSSTCEAAKFVSGCSSHVGECCRGKAKSYKGYVWKYIDDIV